MWYNGIQGRIKGKKEKYFGTGTKTHNSFTYKTRSEKIILFGSLANNHVKKTSDIELFIVMDTEKDFMDRIDEIYRVCKPRVAIDSFVYTPDEIRPGKVSPMLLKEVLTKGEVIYNKEGL